MSREKNVLRILTVYKGIPKAGYPTPPEPVTCFTCKHERVKCLCACGFSIDPRDFNTTPSILVLGAI